jgi:hypothetical protein
MPALEVTPPEAEVEVNRRACLKSRSHVVESGQRMGGEPDATAAIES